MGPYVLTGRLGQGGMGVVYLATDEAGDRVAVKVINWHLAGDPGFRRRFRREVAAAQRVARFCTAPVLAADVDGDLAYLVTEFVPGPSLQEAVADGGPLTGSSLDGLAAGVAVALRAIHGAGIVHRDLKPSNVLLSPVGPKVIDFGVARLVEGHSQASSAVVGTPAYMSPEQVGGAPATPASDVFAWGGVVAYAAVGRGPFDGGSVPAVLYRVTHAEPDLTGLRGPLLPLVTAALAKDPADRPTPQELLDALSAAPAGTVPPLPASPPGTGETVAARDTRIRGIGPGYANHAPAGDTGGPQDDGDSPEDGTGRPGGGTGGPGGDGEPTLEGGARRPSRRRLWTGAAAAASAVVAVAVILQSGLLGGSAGSTASSGPDTAATATSADPARAMSASGPNPLDEDGLRLFTPPQSDAARQAKIWAAGGRARDAALMEAFAEVPQAVWLEGPSGDKARRTVSATLRAAGKTGSVPIFATYHLPFKDCRPTGPVGGAASDGAYRSWIDGIAEEIGDARAVVILEPQSLVNIPGTTECERGDAATEKSRFANLSHAVDRLGKLPRTAVYLDGSFEKWPSLEEMAHRLLRAGVTAADGFFLNASGYQPTEGLVDYGDRLARCVHVQATQGTDDCLDAEIAAAPDDPAALPHFVIDTSRNGRGEWVPDKEYAKPQTWCNPPDRGLGLRPTTATGSELVDAYLWISLPGHSNGTCTRGTDGPEDPVYGTVPPGGGQWWAEMALERARLADPPLR
ncbi:glycoside hydrolase family 6 protein [Planobispora takensis]|uniref:glycoside hydrolase family 6 protein n=1 Tax=Planobispora takensis TaxID=1367882 RepID=UPI001944821A|nr:glycoside hydrolase family 6 protein [Planobispora takensis]